MPAVAPAPLSPITHVPRGPSQPWWDHLPIHLMPLLRWGILAQPTAGYEQSVAPEHLHFASNESFDGLTVTDSAWETNLKLDTTQVPLPGMTGHGRKF